MSEANGNRWSKRLIAFFSLVASLIMTMVIATWIGTPTEIAQYVIIALTFGGLFVIGGQSLVDSFKFYALTKAGEKIPDDLKHSST